MSYISKLYINNVEEQLVGLKSIADAFLFLGRQRKTTPTFVSTMIQMRYTYIIHLTNIFLHLKKYSIEAFCIQYNFDYNYWIEVLSNNYMSINAQCLIPEFTVNDDEVYNTYFTKLKKDKYVLEFEKDLEQSIENMNSYDTQISKLFILFQVVNDQISNFFCRADICINNPSKEFVEQYQVHVVNNLEYIWLGNHIGEEVSKKPEKIWEKLYKEKKESIFKEITDEEILLFYDKDVDSIDYDAVVRYLISHRQEKGFDEKKILRPVFEFEYCKKKLDEIRQEKERGISKSFGQYVIVPEHSEEVLETQDSQDSQSPDETTFRPLVFFNEKLLPLHSIIDIVLNVRYQSLQFSCNSGYNFVVLLEIMAVEGEASGN